MERGRESEGNTQKMPHVVTRRGIVRGKNVSKMALVGSYTVVIVSHNTFNCS